MIGKAELHSLYFDELEDLATEFMGGGDQKIHEEFKKKWKYAHDEGYLRGSDYTLILYNALDRVFEK